MYRVILSLSLVLPFCALAQTGQTAVDYFHRGAQYYIWGQKQKATNEVYTGLSLFPSDPQLNGLAGLLKKEEQQQQQQQQQDQQNDQSKQDQKQQQGQQQKGQQAQSGEKPQDQQNQQAQQDQQQQQAAKQAQDEKQGQSQASAAEEQQKKDQEDKDKEAYATGQMTPEQARQLLDSQKGDEKMLTLKPEGKPVDRSKPFRDW